MKFVSSLILLSILFFNVQRAMIEPILKTFPSYSIYGSKLLFHSNWYSFPEKSKKNLIQNVLWVVRSPIENHIVLWNFKLSDSFPYIFYSSPLVQYSLWHYAVPCRACPWEFIGYPFLAEAVLDGHKIGHSIMNCTDIMNVCLP